MTSSVLRKLLEGGDPSPGKAGAKHVGELLSLMETVGCVPCGAVAAEAGLTPLKV